VRPEEKVGGGTTGAQTASKLVHGRDWPPQGESLAGASQNLKPGQPRIERKIKDESSAPPPKGPAGRLPFVTSL